VLKFDDIGFEGLNSCWKMMNTNNLLFNIRYMFKIVLNEMIGWMISMLDECRLKK